MIFRVTFLLLVCATAHAETLPVFLNDRGTGVATSMFGTYVRRGELLVYPFVEGYHDRNFEYAPKEFGYAGSEDLRGRYRATEGLLFLAYGLTDDVALEFEAATIRASLEKSPADFSAMPRRIEESGLGDVEGQLRWRWRRETARRPELFSYFEAVVPHHRNKFLIGTSTWELKAGTGATRGFHWGTLTARVAAEYSEKNVTLGEYAIEYLKQISPRWRFYAGIEGSQVDEVELITEVQWQVLPHVVLKLNTGRGLTSKATDWAPEIGVLFRVPTSRVSYGR